MKKKKIVMLLLTGFLVGLMSHEAILQLRWRNATVGGEIFFIPMVILLVWFGLVLRDEWRKINLRRRKSGNSRK